MSLVHLDPYVLYWVYPDSYVVGLFGPILLHKLISESKVSTLALKLARESFFGEDVMVQCTVASDRKLPALPVHELELLKNQVLTLFPAYWNCRHEFEPFWTKCTESIGQACKRIRSNTK